MAGGHGAVTGRRSGWWIAPAAALVLALAAGAHASAVGPIREGPGRAASWLFEHTRFAGRSVLGRPVVMHAFGRGERRVLVVGGIHGDEYGAAVARRFAASLRQDRASLPAGARIDVIPCLNPDGEAVRTRANARRVDLNRNMPSGDWTSRLDPRDPASREGCSGGSAPGSEPESQVLIRTLGAGYDAVVMLHSAGGIIDYDGPGGEALARRMSAESGLPVAHLGYQAYIHGSVGRYVPERHGIPVITIELRDTSLTAGLRRALLSAAR